MKKAKFTRPITVPLNPAVFAEIKAITDETEQSMAEWVRDAIDQVLEIINEKEVPTR